MKSIHFLKIKYHFFLNKTLLCSIKHQREFVLFQQSQKLNQFHKVAWIITNNVPGNCETKTAIIKSKIIHQYRYDDYEISVHFIIKLISFQFFNEKRFSFRNHLPFKTVHVACFITKRYNISTSIGLNEFGL